MFLYENGTGGEGVGMVRREIRHYSFLLSGIRMYNDCLPNLRKIIKKTLYERSNKGGVLPKAPWVGTLVLRLDMHVLHALCP